METIIVMVACKAIDWGISVVSGWANRDAIRKAMADVDAYLQSLWGAREWVDRNVEAGNVYIEYAKRMIQARILLSNFCSDFSLRIKNLADKLNALSVSFDRFKKSVEPVLNKIRDLIRDDERLEAADKRRLELYDTYISPMYQEFIDYCSEDTRRVISLFGTNNQFPLTMEQSLFFSDNYGIYADAKSIIERLSSMKFTFRSEWLSAGMRNINPYPDKPPEYANIGTQFVPVDISVLYPSVTDITPQGIIVENITFTGNADGFDAVADGMIQRIQSFPLYRELNLFNEQLIGFARYIYTQLTAYDLATILSKDSVTINAINEYESLEGLYFKKNVTDDIRSVVENFYDYEQNGITLQNLTEHITALASVSMGQASVWRDIASHEVGDGSVYERMVNDFISENEEKYNTLNGFIDSYIRELNRRAEALSSDQRIGDILTGKTDGYRNAVAVKLIGSDGREVSTQSDLSAVLAGVGMLFLLNQ